MKRAIRLPNGKWCGLAAYVQSWRTVRALPPEASVRGFGDWPEPAADVLRELRYGLHDRINRHIPSFGVGRKWDHDWQREVGHTARAVNTPRLIVRWVPAHLQGRLAHRITRGEY